MVTNFLKWIKSLLIALLVFCVPFLCFTQYAFADTSSNITNFRSTGNFVGNKQTFLTIDLPDNSSVSVYSTVYLSGDVSNGMMNLYFQPIGFDTFLGTMYLSKDDLLTFLDGFYIRLHVNNSVDEYGSPDYGDIYEMCYLPLSLFSNDFTLNNVFFGIATGSDYYGLIISNIFDFSYSDFRNFKYSGSYSDVKNNYGDEAYYCYILQTLKHYTNASPQDVYTFNNSVDSLSIESFIADGFAHLDTEEFKLYKKTLQDVVSNSLVSTNQKLDDILNYGTGSFDDLEQDIGNASNKAEQGNQEIQDNAPKPDINDTVNDTSDVIDDALSGESFDKISDLLQAIFANTLISTILLISVAVGAVKYIFFGKG